MLTIRNLIFVSTLLSSAFSYAQVNATAQLQPAGLNPGDTFFVIFSTSTVMRGCANSSTNTPAEIAETTVASINTHADNAATTGTITNGVAGWQSIFIHNDGITTTDTVAASGVAFNNVTNRPIYNTQLQLVANDRNDLFDGSGSAAFPGSTPLINQINFDENGNTRASGTFTFTGFGPLGNDTNVAGTPATIIAMGARPGLTGCTVGDQDTSDGNWAGAGPSFSYRSLYVLSPLLVIPAAVSASSSLTQW